MANQEHLNKLKEGVEVWNLRRDEYPDIRPDLRDAVLRGADLSNADLSNADLRSANLSSAILFGADLSHADLSHAILRGADLRDAYLSGATNLTQQQLDQVLTCKGATLPQGFICNKNP
jgi:uncharacterized protein YjbI with pentapeptide repeats